MEKGEMNMKLIKRENSRKRILQR